MIVSAPKNNFEEREPVATGNHHAVCFGLWGIGTHEIEWQGKTNFYKKVIIMWELPGLPRYEYTIDDVKYDKPQTIWKKYTLSLSDKANLTKDLISWRGRNFTDEELAAFQLKNILGANCLVNIVHNESNNGKIYANVAGVSQLVKGMEKITSESEHSYYNPDVDMEIPDTMPKFVKSMLEQSEEYKSGDPDQWSTGVLPPDYNDGDDIPF